MPLPTGDVLLCIDAMVEVEKLRNLVDAAIVRLIVKPVRIFVMLFVLLVAACGGRYQPDAVTATVTVLALAGPVCPVETNPPSPDCAPRPVVDAVILVTDPSGNELARGRTDAVGVVELVVPPGNVLIVPQAVDGYLGTASPLDIFLTDGQSLHVDVMYDTGIR